MKRRSTVQRLRILDYLKVSEMHPTAEAVHNEVRKEIPTITLATVYRNLNLLAEEGKILKLEINNEFHFDGDTSRHQHCVCRECGMIIDVFQREISDYALKKVKNSSFDPISVQVIFHGLCEKCDGGR